MALGFTYTEEENFKIKFATISARRFMEEYGKAREVKSNQFANLNNMVNPPNLTRTDNDKPRFKWITVKGIKGYKFAINGEEMRCVNTNTDASFREVYGEYTYRYRFANQDVDNRDHSISATPLKIAFCIKYDIDVRNEKLIGKRIAGTLAEPYIKGDKKGEILWDILHNH